MQDGREVGEEEFCQSWIGCFGLGDFAIYNKKEMSALSETCHAITWCEGLGALDIGDEMDSQSTVGQGLTWDMMIDHHGCELERGDDELVEDYLGREGYQHIWLRFM